MSGPSLSAEKECIRSEVRRLRRDMDATWAAGTGRVIQERVLELPAWKQASAVACYLAVSGEVATELVIERGRLAGKTIYVPACDRTAASYMLLPMPESSKLAAGPMGVPEPEGGEPVTPAAIDCFLVPGLAFDEHGMRLGHGGGHYDRILTGAGPAAVKVGLAFGFQVYERIPAERHDVRMDFIVSENRTIVCATARS